MNTCASFSYSQALKNINTGVFSTRTKFGRNNAVGTSYVPVTIGGIYRTPQVGSATKLRIKAGDSNDTAAGTGAQEITLEYINTNGERVIEALATAGASPSAATSQTAIRMDRFYVSKSGTYGTQSAGSHAGNIVIENEAGTEDWGTIDATGFPRSQSEIAATTIEAGKIAYLTSFSFTETSNKLVNLIFFQRQNILETSAPYTAIRELFSLSSPVGVIQETFDPFLGPIPPLTDIGILALSNSLNTVCELNFSLVLVDA